MMRSLSGIVPGNFFATVPESIDVSKRGTRRIIAAIEAGDGERAAAACAEMMRAHGVNVNRVRADGAAPRG